MQASAFRARIDSSTRSRRLLGEPDPAATAKIMDELDENFFSPRPLAVLHHRDARTSQADAPPPPDPTTRACLIYNCSLVIPERLGNRLADSLQNIVQNGHIGMLCFVPGMSETLRINGRATVTDLPGADGHVFFLTVCSRLSCDTRLPYFYCGRALLCPGPYPPPRRRSSRLRRRAPRLGSGRALSGSEHRGRRRHRRGGRCREPEPVLMRNRAGMTGPDPQVGDATDTLSPSCATARA